MTTGNEPEGASPEELLAHGDLEGALLAVATSAKRLSDSVERRITGRLIVAALVAVLGVGLGVIGLWSAHDADRSARHANRALAAFVEKTAEARVAACVNYNRQEARQAGAEKAEERARQAESSVALDRLLVLLHLSPADLTKIQTAHLRRYYATVDRAHQLRDCSPAGIDRFLNQARG